MGFPVGSDGKESAYNAGDQGPIPESGRSLGEGSGYPLQYSCLENSMDRGAWWATVHEKHETQTSNGNQEVEGKEVIKVVRELSSWSFKVIYMLRSQRVGHD